MNIVLRLTKLSINSNNTTGRATRQNVVLSFDLMQALRSSFPQEVGTVDIQIYMIKFIIQIILLQISAPSTSDDAGFGSMIL